MFQCSYVNNLKILQFYCNITAFVSAGTTHYHLLYDVCPLITKLLGKGSATSHLVFCMLIRTHKVQCQALAYENCEKSAAFA